MPLVSRIWTSPVGCDQTRHVSVREALFEQAVHDDRGTAFLRSSWVLSDSTGCCLKRVGSDSTVWVSLGYCPAARAASASRTSTCPTGTSTSNANAPSGVAPSGSKVKVKKEQHALSRAVRSRAVATAAGSRCHRSYGGAGRRCPRRAVANRSSNSASRTGRSAVGRVHASGTDASPGTSLFSLMPRR